MWIDTAMKILLVEYPAYRTEKQIEKLKDLWQEVFGNWKVSDEQAKRAARYCLTNYDKFPTTKQFGLALNEIQKSDRIAKERAEQNKNKSNLPDGQAEINRLTVEGAVASSMLKKIFFNEEDWGSCYKKIAEKMTGLKKAILYQDPTLNDLEVILKIKKMLKEEQEATK